jgi:hypothetical protein
MSDTTPSDLTRLAFGRLNSSLVLPANPAMLQARFSSETLAYNANVVESPEMDPSGQLRDSIFVGASSAGAVEFPLTRHEWFHDMLMAAFRNDFGVGTLAEDIVTPGTFVQRAVAANELIPGKTLIMYAAQKRFDTPTGLVYHLFDRVGVNSLALRVQPNEILSGSVQLMGGKMTATEAEIAGTPTFADPGQYKPFTSPNVTQVTIEGMTLAQCFNSLTLNFASNLRGIPCIGLESDKTKGLGRFVPTIEGTTYFTNNEHVDALLAQTFLEVTITLTDGSGNIYEFYYPKCKLVTAPVTTPGTNQDVMQPISLRAHYDPERLYSCLVTRTLAV